MNCVNRPVFHYPSGTAALLVTAVLCMGSHVSGQSRLPDVVRVDVLDDRNYSRLPILPELRHIASVIEDNCAIYDKQSGGKRPTRAIDDTCRLPDALKAYEHALAGIAGSEGVSLEDAERRIRVGALLGTSTSPDVIAHDAVNYFLAKQYLVTTLIASSLVANQWYGPEAPNFFRYVRPQIFASMFRGTPIRSTQAFFDNVNCNAPRCGDGALAAFLKTATEPVTMITVSDSSTSIASSRILRRALLPFLNVIKINEALVSLVTVASDSAVLQEVIRRNEATVSTAAAAIRTAAQNLQAALLAEPGWMGVGDRYTGLVWIDAVSLATALKTSAGSSAPRASSLVPGEHLNSVAVATRDASLQISNTIIQLRARLAWSSLSEARPQSR